MNVFETVRPVRNFLLMPANPTPNGRLHLGHISGPYLRLDMLGRHVERLGHRYSMILGIDAFDSYVMRFAGEAGVAPEELGSENFNLIKRDLASMKIQVSCFVNLYDEYWFKRYARMNYHVLDLLQQHRRLQEVDELLPYSKKRQQFVINAFLRSTCPDCDQGMTGFICENCGGHFLLKDLKNKKSIWGDADLELLPEKNIFLQTPNAEALLEKMKPYVSGHSYEIIRKHVQERGAWHKMTQSFPWGVPWSMNGLQRRLVSVGCVYSYGIMLGEVYKEIWNETMNPYEWDSDTEIVTAFGFDNIISHLAGRFFMSDGVKKYRPGNGFIVNHFYNLGEEKFSTSRGHVIWVEDIIHKSKISRDALRLYLSMTSPTTTNGKFEIPKFINLVNDFFALRLNHALQQMFEKCNNSPADAIASGLLKELNNLALEQQQYLDYNNYNPGPFSSTVFKWVDLSYDLPAQQAYWWLKGFAWLAYPVMPDLTMQIWKTVSHSEKPSAYQFLQYDPVREQEPLMIFNQIKEEQLLGAFPASTPTL